LEPQEALGYYTTAVAMLEKNLKERDAKGKSKASNGMDLDAELEQEEREQAVTALVAMIEIWMSDLWFVPLPILDKLRNPG
jgi:predicted S18 family serine protease